jgi:hypothetical protein
MKKLQNLGRSLNKLEQVKIKGGDDTELEPGDGTGGDCQSHGQSCATSQALNCCNGLICADYKCAYRTFADPGE